MFLAHVVDANLLTALAIDDARAPIVAAVIQRWMNGAETMHAPSLLPYEVANALTRLVTAGAFPRDRLDEAWRIAMSVPITYYDLGVLGPAVIALSLRLGRRSAYDAAYLALAQHLGADLWTFDGPLARNAAGVGMPVHLVA